MNKVDQHCFGWPPRTELSFAEAGENVVRRPPTVGGRGHNLIGRHELMLPRLAPAVVEGMDGSGSHGS
jgi:hypothetical protein